MTLANPYSVVLLLVGAAAAAVAGYVYREREVPGTNAFAVVLAGGAVWATAYGLQLGAPLGTAQVVLARVRWFGVVAVPTAWLVFALQYTGRGELLSPGTVVLLLLEPLATLMLVWTAGHHGLFWGSTTYVGNGSLTLLVVETYGAWYWVTLVYSAVAILAGMWLLLEVWMSTGETYRRSTVALLLAAGVPLAATVLHAAKLGVGPVPGFDATPLALGVSTALVGWGLARARLFEAAPIVPAVDHDAIVGEIADGVLVVDRAGRIVESTPAVRALSADDVEGRPLGEVFSDLVAVVEEDDAREEVRIDDGERKRYYAVEATGIDRRGERVGHLLTFHDVTDRIIREQRLDVLNRVLRHNVRQETTLILGHSDVLEGTLSGEDLTEHASEMAGAARNLAEWSDQARYIERALERVTQERHPVEVRPAVGEAVSRVRTEHDARVAIDVEEDLWVTSHESLSEAVGEVVENAVVHGTTGGRGDADGAAGGTREDHLPDGDEDEAGDETDPPVTVAARGRDGEVVIEVTDPGDGVPEDEREVFDRGRETPLEHGSGLGLWLVNWVVHASGGRVEFDDAGDGNAVRLVLPRASVTAGSTPGRQVDAGESETD